MRKSHDPAGRGVYRLPECVSNPDLYRTARQVAYTTERISLRSATARLILFEPPSSSLGMDGGPGGWGSSRIFAGPCCSRFLTALTTTIPGRHIL